MPLPRERSSGLSSPCIESISLPCRLHFKEALPCLRHPARLSSLRDLRHTFHGRKGSDLPHTPAPSPRGSKATSTALAPPITRSVLQDTIFSRTTSPCGF